jgi:polysaccharide export outer membrane protein
MHKIKLSPILLILFVFGCTPYESLVNYKGKSEPPLKGQVITNYHPLTIQPSDILRIDVSSTEAEAVAVFSNFQTNGYTVSAEGTIDFPLMGKANLQGKTLEEAKVTLLDGIKKYFTIPPTLGVYLSNFRIVVNGEVKSPGTLTLESNRVSIIEAISRAGDFTSYSKRDSVMVIRETGDQRTFGYINFNSSEMFNSPYFYLKQNDVVYIRPEKRILGTIRTPQDKLIPYVSVGISIILLSLTISRNRN